MSNYVRSAQLASPDQCFVIVSDIQDRLMEVLPDREHLLERSQMLLEGAKLLSIPIVGTEQYPQGLGETVPEIQPYLDNPPAKKRFSCVEALDIPPAAEREDGRFRAVIVGIEAHICVQQTAFDLLSLGYEVIIPADAIDSISESDWHLALRRMESAGMTVTSVQSLLFEWCETAEHPQFKAISRLIQGKV
ncbi:isochorismatase family protein [Rubinisphaera sp. JC750]|uniref:isochorismatase family protein n=1 Tax=Rubinisphaera sp. JC750 TaxID=2898658 RepID=UPI001F20E3AC|nr:isochorismatase family protein [Rubinisphaera sp. JC750]